MYTKVMFCICILSIQSVIIRVPDTISRGCRHRTVRKISCAPYTSSGILKIDYLSYKTLLMRTKRCGKYIYEDT